MSLVLLLVFPFPLVIIVIPCPCCCILLIVPVGCRSPPFPLLVIVIPHSIVCWPLLPSLVVVHHPLSHSCLDGKEGGIALHSMDVVELKTWPVPHPLSSHPIHVFVYLLDVHLMVVVWPCRCEIKHVDNEIKVS